MRPFLLLCLLGLSAVVAAEEKRLSPQSYQIIMAAQKSLDAGDAATAVSALEALQARLQQRPYERAIALQSLAHTHIAREDYAAAIPPLRQSLALGALPEAPQRQARYNLIRLYMATERFSEAIDRLKRWLGQAKQPPPAEAYVMLATAHLQLGQYRAAIEPLRTAIRISKTPKESWYQSLLGAYSERKQYDQCAALLHEMLRRFPDRPGYWRQLAGIQLAREKYRDALATMELAYFQGHIQTERELLNLAQLYLHLDAPYKAAALIEEEIRRGRIEKTGKSWEHAANAWLRARETGRAIAALERSGAASKNPQRGLRLARLYVEAERWEAAGKTLDSLLSAGRLDAEATGKAWMLLGIVRHEARAKQAARAAFLQAKKYRNTASSARQWLAFLDQS